MEDLIFLFLLGIVQGILEWLPVSSSGNVTLLLVSIAHTSFSEAVKVSFFLHAGTMLSVIVKFRSDLYELGKNAFFKQRTPFLDFYIIATACSAVTGIPLYFALNLEIPEHLGSLLIALFLVITGVVVRMKKRGLKMVENATMYDALVVGLAQGAAILPGMSRSGMTIAALLSRGIVQKEALRLSFLLSIPPVVVLMILSFSEFSWIYLISMIVSFVFSLLSMEILLKAAQNLDFSWFCFVVAAITILLIALFL